MSEIRDIIDDADRELFANMRRHMKLEEEERIKRRKFPSFFINKPTSSAKGNSHLPTMQSGGKADEPPELEQIRKLLSAQKINPPKTSKYWSMGGDKIKEKIITGTHAWDTKPPHIGMYSQGMGKRLLGGNKQFGITDENNRPFKILYQLNRIAQASINTVKILTTIFGVWRIIKKLEKVPSALQGVIKLLEIGFLLLLKPLCDLLAVILMPIAVGMIKFAIWINEQSTWVKNIFAVITGIALILLELVSKFGVKGASALAEKGVATAGKILNLVLDTKAMQSFIDKIYVQILEWWNKSKLKGFLDWIYKELLIAYDKSGLKKLFGFITDEIKLFLEKSGLKKLWTYISDKIIGWLGESKIGKSLLSIGGLLENIIGEKVGFGAVIKGLIGTCMKLFNISFYAEIITAIAGWISRKLGEDTFLGQFFAVIEDVANVLAELLNPFNYIIALGKDLWNCLNGDFSFKNSFSLIYNAGIDLVNSFKHLYNAIAIVYNKFGSTLAGQAAFKALGMPSSLTMAEMSEKINQEVKKENNSPGGMYSYSDSGGEGTFSYGSTSDSGSGSTYGGSTMDYDYAVSHSNKYGTYTDSSGKTVIRTHAAGGIVTSPQIGMIGEAGPEAIIPLDRFENSLRNNITVNINGVVDERKMRSIIRDEAEKIFNVHTRVRGNVW